MDECAGKTVIHRQLPILPKTRQGYLALQAQLGDQRIDFAPEWTVTQDHKTPVLLVAFHMLDFARGTGRRPCAFGTMDLVTRSVTSACLPITGIRPHEARQVLLRDEATRGQKVMRRKLQFSAQRLSLASGSFGALEEMLIVNRVIAKEDPLLGHPKLSKVVSVRLAPTNAVLHARTYAPLEPLLDRHARGVTRWLSDIRTTGTELRLLQRRATEAARLDQPGMATASGLKSDRIFARRFASVR